jgi:hypothetical protein
MGQKVIIALIALALGNLLVLNYRVFTRPSTEITKQDISQMIESVITTLPRRVAQEHELDQKESTAAAISPSASPTSAPRIRAISPVPRESFINIGTGSFSSEYDWGNVPGAQVTIDGGAYGVIQSAVFEATVNTPNGVEDVQLRLYNVTASRPVWNSELFFPSGGQTRFLVSPSVVLDPGSNVYQVQMKTQFAAKANLDVARVHILSN